MPSVCQRCGKGVSRGNNVSHAKNRTKKIWKPNLQSYRLEGIKVRVCTDCLRTIKRPKKSVKPEVAKVEVEKVEEKKVEENKSKKIKRSKVAK